jgi:hypothetical protein
MPPEMQVGETITSNPRGNSTGIAPVVLKPPPGPSRDEMLAGLEGLTDDAPLMGESGATAKHAASKAKDAKPAIEVDDREPKPEKLPIEEPDEPDAELEQVMRDRESPPDRETAKSLEKIRKQEARAKEQLARDRAELEQQRRALDDHKREIETERKRSADIARRVKSDPWGVLKSLGLSDEDAEYASRHIYAQTAAAKADPKNRAAIEAEQRVRAESDRISQLEAKLEATHAELARRDQAAAAERQTTAYLDSAAKAVTDEHPLLKSKLAKNPTKTRIALVELAIEMAGEDDGETPSAAALVNEWEKRRISDLEEMGVDVTAYTKRAVAETAAAVTNGAKPALAAAKKPAAIVAPAGALNGVNGVNGKKLKTEEELRSEILAGLDELS